MRYAVLPIVLALGCIAAVFACSSSDDKKDTGDAGGSIIPSGTSSGGSSKGDDDDGDAGCMGVTTLDCTAQAAHAKDGNCSKFDEKTFKEDCEGLNCGTEPSCADKLKAYGDCLLTGKITCNSDGEVDTTATPTECQDKEMAYFNCQTGQ